MKRIKNKINSFIKSFKEWNIPLILVVILLIMVTLVTSFLTFRLDNDFHFLINLGERIINEGFFYVDNFTIHKNLSFFPQQWLTDIIFYLIYNKFNIVGIYIFINIINLIITFLIYKLSMLISQNKAKLSLIITIFTTVISSVFFVTTRPQIFDIVLFLIEIYLLELYIQKNNKLYLIGLPIISLLLINLHSSMWLMLFIILIPYFLDSLNKTKYFKKDKYQLRPLIITTIIMFLVGFINPYHIESIKYLTSSYGIHEINNMVMEMKPAVINNKFGLCIFINIYIVLFSYYFSKRMKLRYFLLFLGTSILSLMHMKGYLFLLICSIPSLCYSFKDKFKYIKQEKYYHYKVNNIFIVTLFFIFLGIISYFIYDFNLEENNKHILEDVANYLDTLNIDNIKLYTGYDDGAYLEYRGYKCYIDPRAELFLKANNKQEDIIKEYYNLQEGNMDYQEFLDKYKFDYLVVREGDVLYTDILGYEIVYEKELVNNKKNITRYRIYKRIG